MEAQLIWSFKFLKNIKSKCAAQSKQILARIWIKNFEETQMTLRKFETQGEDELCRRSAKSHSFSTFLELFLAQSKHLKKLDFKKLQFNQDESCCPNRTPQNRG